MKGIGRATLYLPAPQVQANISPETARAEPEDYVPLIGESPTLRDWVRRPLTLRRPVGYDRALLDNYQPNKTYYLNDADWRARLRDIGRSPLGARPAGTYARDILNRLLIDLSWASSHLEGNTYTRLDKIGRAHV